MPVHRDRSHLYLGIAPYSAVRPPLDWYKTRISPSRNLLGDYLMYNTPRNTSSATLPSDGTTHRKQDRQDRFLYDDDYYT